MSDKEKSAQTDEEFTEQEWVCTHFEIAASKKLGVAFRVLDSKGKIKSGEGSERFFEAKKHNVQVGHVYKVSASATQVKLPYVWVRMYEDKEKVAEWQLRERARKASERVEQAQKKETARNLPLEVLQPFADAYSRSDYYGRIAIEIIMIEHIRRYGVRKR